MALSVTTGTIQVLVTPTSPTNAKMRLYQNRWDGNPTDNFVFYFTHWGKTVVTENGGSDGSSDAVSGVWTTNTGADLDADTDYLWRAHGVSNTTAYGVTKTKRTNAMVAAMVADPSASAVTSTTATISTTYLPNTTDSSCSAQLQYKKVTDGTWTNAGAAATNGGYSNVAFSRDITGLTSSTQYQMQLVITRTTENGTSLTSTITNFTTSAGVPVVTTDAATGVTSVGAVLNGTLDINDGTGVNVHFNWDTVSPPSGNSTADQAMSADGSFQASLTDENIAPSTTYYFKAVATFTTPTGRPVGGDILSFTSPASPGADAILEDHVQTLYFDRKYGVLLAGATLLKFAVRDVGSSSSDRLLTTASPFATSDVKISKDGGAFANTTNLPAQVTASNPGRTLVLTAAELQCQEAHVVIRDADGPAFRDLDIIVRTKQDIGQINVDATEIGSSASAFNLTPATGGYGVAGTGSPAFNGSIRQSTATAGGASTITLDASASATNDFYNGCIIVTTGGTSPNQQRVIVDYDGTSKVATVHKSWNGNPASGTTFLIVPGSDLWEVSPLVELAALPGATSGFGKLLQFVFQRFAYKRTQTATLHTMRNAGDTADLATATVSDNGTTQVFGGLS